MRSRRSHLALPVPLWCFLFYHFPLLIQTTSQGSWISSSQHWTRASHQPILLQSRGSNIYSKLGATSDHEEPYGLTWAMESIKVINVSSIGSHKLNSAVWVTANLNLDLLEIVGHGGTMTSPVKVDMKESFNFDKKVSTTTILQWQSEDSSSQEPSPIPLGRQHPWWSNLSQGCFGWSSCPCQLRVWCILPPAQLWELSK